jgi:hypothetical protein
MFLQGLSLRSALVVSGATLFRENASIQGGLKALFSESICIRKGFSSPFTLGIAIT